MRLDIFLYEKNLVTSRTRASNLIKLGGVKVNGKVIDKSSYEVDDNDTVEVTDVIKYCSLGGVKLEKAINTFGIKIFGTCIDLGSSNGGFVQCLLEEGGEKVYAVDIGDCALPEELAQDKRVVVLDRTNARNLPLDGEIADFVTADLSFISITLILPEIKRVLKKGGKGIVLVKPQFEVGRSGLTKSGIVKSEKLRLRALDNVKAKCIELGLEPVNYTEIPLLFDNKNTEYLLLINKQ